MALLYGFCLDHESNERQEVFASVAPASDDAIDVKVEFPEVSQASFAAVEPLNALLKSISLHKCLVSSCVKVYRVLQQHAVSNAVRKLGLGASEKRHKLNNGLDLDAV